MLKKLVVLLSAGLIALVMSGCTSVSTDTDDEDEPAANVTAEVTTETPTK